MKRVISLLFLSTFTFMNIICLMAFLPQESSIIEIKNEVNEPPNLYNKTISLPEIEWRPIEDSLNYSISKKESTINNNSGAIIDEFHVLTCGHNVYLHDNGGWASSVEVIPGMDGSYEPFGSAMVVIINSRMLNQDKLNLFKSEFPEIYEILTPEQIKEFLDGDHGE